MKLPKIETLNQWNMKAIYLVLKLSKIHLYIQYYETREKITKWPNSDLTLLPNLRGCVMIGVRWSLKYHDSMSCRLLLGNNQHLELHVEANWKLLQLVEQRYNMGKEGTPLIFHTHPQARDRFPIIQKPTYLLHQGVPTQNSFCLQLSADLQAYPYTLLLSPGTPALTHPNRYKGDQRQVFFPLQGPTEAVDLFSVRWLNMYR